MTRCLVAILALLAAVPTAQARDITGQVTYPERIALAEQAQLVVELRGPGGIVVAEARIETAGRQVPLSFTLVAPDAGEVDKALVDGIDLLLVTETCHQAHHAVAHVTVQREVG